MRAFPKPAEAEGRTKLSDYRWRKLRRETWDKAEREGKHLICGICRTIILCFEDFTLDHIKPMGMGGGSRNDSVENLRPAHFMCNVERGSKRT